MSLPRCSISSAVIGSPLTMTTTCWACAMVAGTDTARTSIAAANSRRARTKKSNVSVIAQLAFSTTTASCPSPPWPHSAAFMSTLLAAHPAGEAGGALAGDVSTQRAQADLHHERMVDRHAATISIICNVIQGQDEAVVDISDADLRLAELVGPKVVARRPHQHPVGVELQPRAAEDALAAIQEAERRLGGVVAVHQHGGPAPKIGGRLEFGALQRGIVLIEAETRRVGEGRIGLVGHPCHVIRTGGVEAALQAGIGGCAERERVLSEQLVGLSEQDIDVAAAIELGGVLEADIRPAAAFRPVPTGELVDLEQVRIVEDEALRVLVGEQADGPLVGAEDELGDR